MSSRSEQQHNLKVAELGYTAFSAGDLETLLKLCHEEIEVTVAPGQAIGAGTHNGHQGYREWYERCRESFDDLKVQVLDVLPIGARHLVVVVKLAATGKESGSPVEMESGNMLGFRDGNVIALHVYATREEAVAAAKEREKS
ncbi:MAG: nuclear transport factor 2 family protein [Solirubrobacterales bacterium]